MDDRQLEEHYRRRKLLRDNVGKVVIFRSRIGSNSIYIGAELSKIHYCGSNDRWTVDKPGIAHVTFETDEVYVEYEDNGYLAISL